MQNYTRLLLLPTSLLLANIVNLWASCMMDRRKEIDDFYRKLHAAKPAAEPATERRSPPPGLEAITSGMSIDGPTQNAQNSAPHPAPGRGTRQQKPRFRRMYGVPADAVGTDRRDRSIKRYAEDGPMGFGFYAESADDPNIVNFYPATGVSELLQQGQQPPRSRHYGHGQLQHGRQSRRPSRADLTMPPHGIPPPPDMRGPEWQAYFASLPPPEPSYPDCVLFF